MKSTRFSLKIFGEKLILAKFRFPLTFVCVTALVVLFILAIHTNTDDIYTKWIMSGIVSAFATLSFYLFAENRWNKLIVNLGNLLLIGLSVWLFSSYSGSISDANATQFALLLASFTLALFFAGSISEKKSLRWWNNLQEMLFQMIISAFFAGVLMGGLSLALVSLDQLFDVKIKDEVFQYLAVFCFVLFMPSYFMSQISEKEANETILTISYPHIFKILGLYILLPILTIYTLILYGYLVKIIVGWELPNGWLSWLVSILGFAGFLTMIVLHPLAGSPSSEVKSDNFSSSRNAFNHSFQKIVNAFVRFFPIILLPLLILMFVGIQRRFSDYGITINRLLILILNLWFIGISIYLFFSRSRQPKWILISFACVAFLAAIGPWSTISITKNSLTKEFSELLKEANWTNTENSKIKTLSKEKQTRLSDITYYLQRTYGKESLQPMIGSLGSDSDAKDILKALNINRENSSRSEHIRLRSSEKSFELAVTDFEKSVYLNKDYNHDLIYKSDSLSISLENNSLKISQNEKETVISLSGIIEKGKSGKNHTLLTAELTLDSADYLLYVFSLDAESEDDGKFTIYNFEGLLFIR
ncbi:MAG: DUF4153 domain-containing protein [Paludibacteraceae bacterium]